uniref:Polyprotein n=1 Tax=Chuzhou tick virus 1 TaxID=2972182 RepID=A0A9E8AAB1_9VIRU|nr:MAG: polyprotein [Chuzhou tick virus 1]
MPRILKITSEDLSSSTVSEAVSSRVRPALIGRYPLSVERQVQDRDFQSTCKCQCHIEPPVFQRHPERRKFLEGQLPRHGPMSLRHKKETKGCSLSDNERKRNFEFKVRLLTTTPAEPSWVSGKVPAEFKEFESPQCAPLDAFKLSYCYQDVVLSTMRWKGAQVLGPECLATCFRLFFNVGGMASFRYRDLVESEPGFYHIRVRPGSKGSCSDAGKDFARQLDELILRDPSARIGLLVMRYGGFTAWNEPTVTQTAEPRKQTVVTWPTFKSRPELTAQSPDRIEHPMPVLKNGEGLNTEGTRPVEQKASERKKTRIVREPFAHARPTSFVFPVSGNRFDPIRSIITSDEESIGTWDDWAASRPVRPKPKRIGVNNEAVQSSKERYRAWMVSCINRKRYFGLYKAKGHHHWLKGGNKCLKIVDGRMVTMPSPETLEGITLELCAFFSSMQSVSLLDYLHAAYWYKENRFCPARGFIVNWHNGDVSISRAKGHGISWRLSGEEFMRMGDDDLTVYHPEPRSVEQGSRRRRATVSVEFVNARHSLAFTDLGSPIDNVMVTSPTPTSPLVQNLHSIARNSAEADVELNPGPERGRSHSPSPATGTIRSRSKSVADAARKLMGTAAKTPADIAAKLFGYGGTHDVEVAPQCDNWLYKSYQIHHRIGSFPSNKRWILYEPCWSDRKTLLNTCQRSLDSLFFASRTFSVSHVAEVMNTVNTFMQKTPLSEGFDFRSVSALAHLVKTKFDCPQDGRGYAIELNSLSNHFVLHETDNPSPDLVNRLVWTINDSYILHGGSQPDDCYNGVSFHQFLSSDEHDLWKKTGRPVSLDGAITPRDQEFLDTYTGRPGNYLHENLDLVLSFLREQYAPRQGPYGHVTVRHMVPHNLFHSVRLLKDLHKLCCPEIDSGHSYDLIIDAASNQVEYHIQNSANGESVFNFSIKHRGTIVNVCHAGQPRKFDYKKLAWEDATKYSRFHERQAEFLRQYQEGELTPLYSEEDFLEVLKDESWASFQFGHFYRNFYYFYFLVYYFFASYFMILNYHLRPDVPEYGSGPHPDDDRPNEECLHIGMYGTQGDITPIHYFTNLARHYGVPVKEKVHNKMDNNDLESLREGDFIKFMPKQLHMVAAGEFGFRKVFLPHIEIDPKIGESYCLNPSSRFVNDTKFVDDWNKVALLNILPAIFATLTTKVVDHTWRIGAIADCQLPRSCNGKDLLKRKTNLGINKVGWISGSASIEVIPSHIRNSFPEIPRGDHNEIFRNYEQIYSHGGAGTVQTTIACGATPVVCDPTLDRDYHRQLTPNDFKQPTIGPFMGWLVWSGFQVDAPFLIKTIWLMSFFWSVKFRFVKNALYNLIKLTVMVFYFKSHWTTFLILLFAIPSIVWRVVHRTTPVTQIGKTIFWGIWNFPLFCLVDSKFRAVVLLYCSTQVLKRLLYDYANGVDRRTELVYEPVERQGVSFPFPFGHWSVRDKQSGLVYEGAFTTATQTIGSPFKFRATHRELRTGAKTFPALFNVADLDRDTKLEFESKPYGAHHNCTTVIAKHACKQSFIWAIFMITTCGVVFLALSPPQFLRAILRFCFPKTKIEETPFYLKLGFAAGIENIPFELEETGTSAIPFLEGDPAHTPPDTNWSDPESFDALVNELAVIQVACQNTGVKTLTKEDFEEATQRTLLNEIEKVPISVDKLLEYGPIPPYVKHTWAQIVDGLHHCISFVSNSQFISTFIAWLRTITNNVVEFLMPILEALSYIANLSLGVSGDIFYNIFVQVCHLMDYCWGLEASNRVKTAWGLTGLHRTGMLGVKARLAANIAYSEFVGRTDFESDFNKLVNEGKELAKKYHAIKRSNLGGPQRRPVGYGKPLMSKQEANLLGFQPGEYATDDEYQRRIDSYLKQGTQQGADGVFLADKMDHLIAKSQHRYEPTHPVLNTDERAFARSIAEALFNKYPHVFADCDILPPRAVHNYIKAKYSPGTPFIKPGGFKSRQAMFDAGYDKVMQRRAEEKMLNGTYDCQFYHAFVKSQVVDIKKCLPFEEGGANKDVRTVVSQDLFSYYQDQCIQIERNKRINWDSYGAGIGMPLNQSMEKIFSRMAERQRERGGRYIELDANAFDSFCKPFLFEVSANLWDLGFKDHPSGNGRNISSIVRASYDARQNGWIIGITEKEHNNLCIAIPDHDTRKQIEGANIKNLMPLAELIDYSKFNIMSNSQKEKYIANLELPPNKTILTWDPKLRPNKANWMGIYRYGDTSDVASQFFANHTLTYEPGDFAGLKEDIRRVATSNYRLLSNVHPKNSGGSTGGSDTSNINTVMFKAGVIAAWCDTVGRQPHEFFEYNDLANTSDDTIWQSGGEHGLNTVQDIEKFKVNCARYGINLKMSTTKAITDVEYLSKFVRTPTPTDSAALKLWRTQKIKAINHSNKQRGLPIAKTIPELNNPKLLVVQNPTAILHRRTAFRYYQSSFNKWRYTSIERGSGHAYNTAFLPELYEQFALEWVDDVNALLDHHKIHRKFALRNGQFGLQEVKQIDPRAGQQALSPRQVAFLQWLKGNMFPTYYKVIDVHMDVKKIDPEQHAKFLRKLNKGWRGYEQIAREGVDWLFQCTNSIPDEWSKKFQPGIEMLYAEQPFYTKNKIVEQFVYLKLLEESPEEEITFGDFSTRLQESPYGGACDPYHFWEQMQDKTFKQQVHETEIFKIQGLVFCVSALYMLTTAAETVLLSIPFFGTFYKLFLWSFIGLNKIYGILNTMYWHSTGKSSREISRIMPRDPYITAKQFCVFVTDFLPDLAGYLMLGPILLFNMLPPLLESIGKTWYVAGKVKRVDTPNTSTAENPWAAYADEYVDKLRTSPTRRSYVAAKTATGKSTMFIAALWAARNRKGIRKIWLIEPRKVLRDETVIPFGIPSQKLKKGITISKSTDIYICTYGHLQSRLSDIDCERDIVLFDEFHEEQGEMILGLHTVKAFIFLLSATPIDVKSLRGSTFLAPNIDRRFPITVHKMPDGMSVPDMYQEAKNRYPEKMDRILVIVPTMKQVQKTIAALTYLGAGEIHAVTRRDRKVPKTGIMVSTPYVQTGLDIKPPPKLLIDSGKDVVFDKGRFVAPLPWTDKDTNNQRIGRTGRLEAGVVFQPESAGSGAKVKQYPSPNLFMHEVVADHFKVPRLTPLTNPVLPELPFMRLNTSKLSSLQAQKSVTFIHALSLHGVRQVEWKSFYTRKLEKKGLGEDNEWLDRIYNHWKWSHVPLTDWDTALYHLSQENVVQYSILNNTRWSLPLSPINGQWQELELTPTERMSYERITEEQDKSKHVEIQKQLNKFRSHLLREAQLLSPDHYNRAAAALA